MVVTLIFISSLLCCVRGGAASADYFFSVSLAGAVWLGPCGQGGVQEHRCEKTRTGGTDRAMHPPREMVLAAAGRGGAARPPLIPRSRPRAARAGAWTRSAGSFEAGARSLPPTVLMKPGGSRWRGGWAPQ